MFRIYNLTQGSYKASASMSRSRMGKSRIELEVRSCWVNDVDSIHHKVYIGLIIKGTIPKVPPFSL